MGCDRNILCGMINYVTLDVFIKTGLMLIHVYYEKVKKFTNQTSLMFRKMWVISEVVENKKSRQNILIIKILKILSFKFVSSVRHKHSKLDS